MKFCQKTVTIIIKSLSYFYTIFINTKRIKIVLNIGQYGTEGDQ